MPKLKDLREEARLSQSQLAKRVGISKSYISQMEQGTRRMTQGAANKLAPVLGVEPGELVAKDERNDSNTLRGRDKQADSTAADTLPVAMVIGAVWGLLMDYRIRLVRNLPTPTYAYDFAVPSDDPLGAHVHCRLDHQLRTCTVEVHQNGKPDLTVGDLVPFLPLPPAVSMQLDGKDIYVWFSPTAPLTDQIKYIAANDVTTMTIHDERLRDEWHLMKHLL